MIEIKYNDIYFSKDYGELYEEIEDGKLEIFEYNSDKGSISNMYIKREIPIEVNNEKTTRNAN